MDLEKKKKIMEDVLHLLVIDEERLDEEISRQAELFMEFARRWVQAEYKAMVLDMDLERYAAELRRRLREELGRDGKKVTEGMLEDYVLSDEGHIELKRELLEAKREAKFWGVVKDAFKQKKDMLEAKVNQLMVFGSTKERIRLESDEEAKEIRRKLRSVIRRKLREEEENYEDKK